MHPLLDHVSDGIAMLDRDWRITEVNRQAELLFGRRAQDIVGQVWWTLFPYICGTPGEDELRAAAASGMPRRLRIFHPPRYAWHDVTAVPEGDGLALVLRDVTDIVRARQAEAVREAVREVVDRAPLAVVLMRGADHRVELMNQMARQVLGGHDLEGRSIRAALPELEGQGLFELLDQVYSTARPYQAREVPVQFDRSGDGALDHGCFDIVYQPVFDVDGTVSGVLSLSFEITDIVAERQQVQRRRVELEAVLHQLSEGVIIADAEGRVTFVNEVARDLYGGDGLEAEPQGYASTHALLSDNGDPLAAEELPLARAVRGEAVKGARWTIRRPDGTTVAVRGDAGPVLDPEGEPIAAVLTFRRLEEGSLDAPVLPSEMR
jgi:PAS domain-containing protein